MDKEVFLRLLEPAGEEALRLASAMEPREENFLAHKAELCRAGLDGPLASAALETVILRRRAREKFTLADRMFFDRESLEQASSEICARHRAKRFRDTNRIADLGCSIGGDAIALADYAPLTAVDREPLRLLMARENLAVYTRGADVSWVQADLNEAGLLDRLPLRDAAVFCDPSRREDGRRVFSVRQYSPAWDVLDDWRRTYPDMRLCVKASPGIRLHEIEDGDPEVEFVSLRGELKEAVVWYGAFRTAARRATLLPEGETMTGSEPESAALSQPCNICMNRIRPSCARGSSGNWRRGFRLPGSIRGSRILPRTSFANPLGRGRSESKTTCLLD